MAYRCKSCGYRFKASDSDLCPECFTARDDISCLDTPDGAEHSHNHFKDSAGGDDFIARQLREESRVTGDELLEEIAGITDSIRRSTSSVTPPNTYSSIRYPQSARAPYPTAVHGQVIPGCQRNGADRQKKKRGKGISAVIIALMFLPFISDFGKTLINGLKSHDIDIDDLPIHMETTQQAEEPEATAEEVTIYGEISDISFAGNYYDPYELQMMYQDTDLQFTRIMDEGVWHAATCRVTLDSEDWRITNVIQMGEEAGGATAFIWNTANNGRYGSGSRAFGVPLIFNDSLPENTITIVCEDDHSGETTITIDLPTAEALSEIPQEKLAESPDAGSYSGRYDYEMGSYYVSLTDLNGSGSTLRISGVLFDGGFDSLGSDVTLDDEGLRSEEWKLCNVMIVEADGKSSPGAADYRSREMVGYDAYGAPVFVFKSSGPGLIPICGRVRDYELTLGYTDSKGFDKEARFTFSANDLYNTALDAELPTP